jgi:nucleoside 2-deoxyribosyltransferase
MRSKYQARVERIPAFHAGSIKKIYLAGPISGLTYDGAQDWRDYFASKVDPRIAAYSPLRGKDYLKMRGTLEGSYAEFPLSTDQGITARDRYDCMGADLVVFNMLGATRVSIGTMIEFGWCDAARNPAIVIMEKEGNIHDYPMVRQIAQFCVDNVNDAINIANIILLPGETASETRAKLTKTYADLVLKRGF